MSRNGSGTYNLPAGNPVVTGTSISSTWANNTLADIATALTGSVAADGQTPMTGALDMNSNKIENLTAGTVAGDAVEFTQFEAAQIKWKPCSSYKVVEYLHFTLNSQHTIYL